MKVLAWDLDTGAQVLSGTGEVRVVNYVGLAVGLPERRPVFFDGVDRPTWFHADKTVEVIEDDAG